MNTPQRPWWERVLCWLGWHRRLGVTQVASIRCYGCSKNYDPLTRTWYGDPIINTGHVVVSDPRFDTPPPIDEP